MRKSTILFLALLLPVLIFLFLRFFGKNEFSIPVYYEKEVENQPTGCDGAYEFPYRIPQASSVPIQGVTVVFFGAGQEGHQLEESIFQLQRLQNLSFSKAINTVWVDCYNQNIAELNNSLVIMDSLSYNQEKNCNFLMQSNTMVLVDSVRRIRGYYKEASLKETDRLIMELKILFNNY